VSKGNRQEKGQRQGKGSVFDYNVVATDGDGKRDAMMERGTTIIVGRGRHPQEKGLSTKKAFFARSFIKK